MEVCPPRSCVWGRGVSGVVGDWVDGGEEWAEGGEGMEKGKGKGLTQTLKLRFLYVTDSTLKPIVGMVVTTSPIYVSSTPSIPHLCFELVSSCRGGWRAAGKAYLESI